MELIHALEQLTIEVKRQQKTIKSNQESKNQIVINGGSETQDNSLDNATNTVNSRAIVQHINQLEQFDDSIRTLFAQLNSLDNLDRNQRTSLGQTDDLINSGQQQIDAWMRSVNSITVSNNTYASTIESQPASQEDSEFSLQRSLDATSNNNLSNNIYHYPAQRIESHSDYADPFVRDFLKKDLGSITNSVRKMSQTLALGDEIKRMSSNLFEQSSLGTEEFEIANARIGQIDLEHMKSLCHLYFSLCDSEPYMKNLPKIIRYNEFCCKLLAKIDNYTQISSNSYTNNNERTMIDLKVGSGTGVDRVCLEGPSNEEVTFLESDIEFVDNWTENKLYMNNTQH